MLVCTRPLAEPLIVPQLVYHVGYAELRDGVAYLCLTRLHSSHQRRVWLASLHGSVYFCSARRKGVVEMDSYDEYLSWLRSAAVRSLVDQV